MIVSSKYNEAKCALYSEEYIQELLNRQSDGSLEDARPIYGAEDAVAVFELLEQHVPLHLIVLKTRLLPQIVKRIRREYEDMVGAVTVPKTILDQMNLLRMKLTGPFPLQSATDILTVLNNAAEDRTCFDCKNASCAELCVPCVRKRFAPPAPTPAPALNGTSETNGTRAATISHGNGSSMPAAPSSQNPRQS